MEPAARPPSEVRRALWIYAVLASLVLLPRPSNLLSLAWWQQQGGRDLAELAFFAVAGVVLGLRLTRDIRNLVVRRNALWKDVLAAVLVIGVFAALVLLRELDVWLWSFDVGDALVVALLATMAVVTLLTEHRKQVRVYAYARHFVFVRRPPSA